MMDSEVLGVEELAKEEGESEKGARSAQNPEESITWGEQKEGCLETLGYPCSQATNPRESQPELQSSDQDVPNTGWLPGLS